MVGTTEEIKIRELPEKDSIGFSDKFIIEDNDGTKQVSMSALRSLMQKCIFLDNIEAMKSANLREGDVIQTLGYYKPHDGGGALYQIVYAPTDLEDGMLVHYLHTSDTLRARLVKPYKLNVLWAGAKGDGITDDYTAIRKALDSGLPVYFPHRTYKIRTALELNNRDMIRGIEFNCCTLLCESSACLSLVSVADVDIKDVILLGKNGIFMDAACSNITISDATIASHSNDVNQNYGIKINGSTDIKICNCDIGDNPFKAPTTIGISIGAGDLSGSIKLPERILIDKCNIQAQYHGVEDNSSASTKGLTISHCEFSGPITISRDDVEYGIWIGSNNKNIHISDCGFSKINCGIGVTGIVSPSIITSNLAFYNTLYAYNVLSENAYLSLDGPQHVYHDGGTSSNFIFKKMNGHLTINTYDIMLQDYHVRDMAYTITGELNDMTDSKRVSHAGVSSYKIANIGANICNQTAYLYEGVVVSSLEGAIKGQKIKLMAVPGSTSVRSGVEANDSIILGGGKEFGKLPITLQYTGACWIEV